MSLIKTKKKEDHRCSWVWLLSSSFVAKKRSRWFFGLVLLGLLLCHHLISDDIPFTTNSILERNKNDAKTDATPRTIRATTKTTTKTGKLKKILYYTTYWGMHDFQFGTGHQPFLDYQCPVSDCIAHARKDVSPLDKDSFGSYDAVLFAPTDMFQNNHKLNNNENLTQAKAWRRPHQRFVYFNMESPIFMSARIHNPTNVENFFNWTMTYRWDSDIPRPYGWIQNRSTTTTNSNFYAQPPRDDWLPYRKEEFVRSLPSRPESFHALAHRPGKVAWIASNCQTLSRREDYVRLLNRHIPVDIFGKCQPRGGNGGNNSTRIGGGRNSGGGGGTTISCDTKYSVEREDNCTTHVRSTYKFYLSFENAFCNDYVTEKFFRRMESSVVIVLGQANYSRHAPPHSYIDVMDYPDPKALAEYLHRLDQNDTEYLSYFWWKDHYDVVHPYKMDHDGRGNSDGVLQKKNLNHSNNFGQAMCHLCAKLHNDQEREPVKFYEDFEAWWDGGGNCGKLTDDLEERMSRGGPNLPGMMRYAKSNNNNKYNKQALNRLKAFLPPAPGGG